MTRLRAIGRYLCPAPGQSTHARVVDCRRWRLLRPFAFAAIAGLLTFAYIGIAHPDVMHNEWNPDTGVFTVDSGPFVWPEIDPNG